MKTTCTLIMAAALCVGLIHATPAFAWHLKTVGESYMMLVYLSLVIIVFLGFYATIIPRNGRSVHPKGKHLLGKFDPNKIHDKPVAQDCAAHVGQMIDATVVEVSGFRNSREKDAQVKTGVTPTAWQEKSAQSKLQEDVDACWIKKRKLLLQWTPQARQ